MAIVDRVDATAHRIGAINTVVVQNDGSLAGKNTDAFGFIQSLQEVMPTWRADAGPSTVIGAGGASRAVIAGLLDQGATQIRLVNRSLEKAQAMAGEFGPCVKAIPWSERHAALGGAALLVNTTNQGMHGEAALDLNLDDLDAQALVSDIVYAPLETPLLKSAKVRGNVTVNGLGMLVHQARAAFEAWFGVMPTVSAPLMEKVRSSF
jgi:shikimate dehydrogenase